jgi:hypothetical protein
MKKNNTISQENEKNSGRSIFRGDLVKFAKTFPDQNHGKRFCRYQRFCKKIIKRFEFENLRKDV